MRRADRQVTDRDEIAAILERCQVCRLGMIDADRPYIVPLNYGYDFRDGVLRLYFHCAKAGKKLDVLARNPNVCFEMDGAHRIVIYEDAGRCTMEYESVIGFGTAELVGDLPAKKEALRLLMRHTAPDYEAQITDAHARAVAVIGVTAHSYTAKRNRTQT